LLFLGGNNDKSHYEQFEIPDSWEWCRLGDICHRFQYGTSQKSDKSGKIAVLRMGNIYNGEIDYSDLVFTSDDSDINKYLLLSNDLLFNRTNSSELVGKTAVYRGDRPALFAGYIIRVKSILINPFYLNLLMNSEHHKSMCSIAKTDGVNQSNINAQKLSNFVYPIAPYSEQCRIVDVIEKAFSIIDKIECDRANLQTIVAAAKSKILFLAIRGKLVPQNPADEPANILLEHIQEERESLIKQGKIKRSKGKNAAQISVDNSYYGKLEFDLPDSWRWYRLADYWDLLSGRDLTPTEYSDEQIGIPYITGASNFTNNGLIINRWTSQPKVIAKDGDLLITCKGTVWEMRINTQGEIHIARQIMAIRNLGVLNIEFLRIVIDSFAIKIISAAKGIIPGISREDLLNMLIPCPPLFEQARIVKAINDANYALNEVVENLN
jgi:type I restriction enzyme S subunit